MTRIFRPCGNEGEGKLFVEDAFCKDYRVPKNGLSCKQSGSYEDWEVPLTFSDNNSVFTRKYEIRATLLEEEYNQVSPAIKKTRNKRTMGDDGDFNCYVSDECPAGICYNMENWELARGVWVTGGK